MNNLQVNEIIIQVWTINATQVTSTHWDEIGRVVENSNTSLGALGESRFVFPATEQNIQQAKKFIQDLTSESSKLTVLEVCCGTIINYKQ